MRDIANKKEEKTRENLPSSHHLLFPGHSEPITARRTNVLPEVVGGKVLSDDVLAEVIQHMSYPWLRTVMKKEYRRKMINYTSQSHFTLITPVIDPTLGHYCLIILLCTDP